MLICAYFNITLFELHFYCCVRLRVITVFFTVICICALWENTYWINVLYGLTLHLRYLCSIKKKIKTHISFFSSNLIYLTLLLM